LIPIKNKVEEKKGEPTGDTLIDFRLTETAAAFG
jgi:hypothetical protein